jgi:hypothetical protein
MQSTSNPPPSAPPTSASKNNLLVHLLLILGVLLLLASLGFATYLFLKKEQPVPHTTVSGTVHFNALKPDENDVGDIHIQYRPYGSQNPSSDYKDAVVINSLKQDAAWNWDGADDGKSYEMQAVLSIDGSKVKTSDPIVVSAPADDQEFNLKITWEDLPKDVVNTQKTDVGGVLNIRGLLPVAGNVNIYAKDITGSEFKLIKTVPSSQDESTWLWPDAVPLQTYAMKAALVDSSGVSLGQSDLVTAKAGEQEVSLVINSDLQPTPTITPTPTQAPIPTLHSSTPTPSMTPAPTSTPMPVDISGTVNINGAKDANTSLLLLWRYPGQGTYQVIQRIDSPQVDAQEWSFNSLIPGMKYEITAALQVNMNNTATTQSQIVTAPADDITFTLNTGVSVGKPSDKPSLEVCNPNGTRYDATVKFPKVNTATAGNYWFQIGDNPGQSNLYSTKVKADNSQGFQRVTLTVDSGRNYYSRYAYSLCVNCSADSNFSSFSDDLIFSCGNSPVPTPGGQDYKGYRCNPDLKVCELTRDDNPPYSLNNAGLVACQSACGK